MTAHADFPTLLAYWLDELDETREAALEEHYLGCEKCSERLAEVEALAGGVRRALAGGRIAAVLTPAFAERLRSQGARVREYRLPPNGSVNCTVAPDDDVLLSYLEAPLEGVERLDAILLVAAGQAGAQSTRLENVPFDSASGQVVIAPGIAHIRTLPAHRQVMRLLAVDADGERVLGEYTFNHSPFPG